MRSVYKDNLATTDVKTSRKNQFIASSPYGSHDKGRLSSLKFRSPLREQQVEDYNRIKTELKREISMAKENFSLNQSGQWVTMQEYLALRQETKYQSERLLYEIQKLHEEIYDLERRKNLQIQKMRQENDQNTFLNMSQIRQGHSSQIQLLQTQLRKTKQMMNDKSAQNDALIKRQEREIKQLTNQNNRLNQEVRNIIGQKNSQLQSQLKVYEQKMNVVRKQHQKQMNQLKQVHIKEINKLNSQLQVRNSKITYQQTITQSLQEKCFQLQMSLQQQSYQSTQQRYQVQQQLKLRYNQLKQTLQQQNYAVIDQINNNYQMKQQMLINQIVQLKGFLNIKNQDRLKLIQLYEQRVKFSQQLLQERERQNVQLKNKLNQMQSQNMQQLEILKVKVTALNQANIKTLVQTYENKIQTLMGEIVNYQSTIDRLTKNLYEETNQRYQMRKKYSIQFSQLNQKIIKLRSGITNIQNDFKQKLQNQKSMLLLTSRNLIKDFSTKQNDAKTTQIQLHKIQLLYQENYKQLQVSNEIIDEKVKIAQQQLHRLTSHVMQQKKRHIETQNAYKLIVQNKNQQIQKLQHQLNSITHPQFDNSKQLQLIDQLKSQLHQKKLQNAQLKDQCQLLQKKISIMKAEIDQYHIEQEITQQQAKKQFQKISQQNMDQFLKFYQSRINTLQQQKNDLKQLISSKQQKITSLVQKYQELQKTMKQTLAKIKKRTQLQTKVMALGTDNNLVKNMAEIVRNNNLENNNRQ